MHLSFGDLFSTAVYPSLAHFMKCVNEYITVAAKEQPAFDLFNKMAEEFCSFSRVSNTRKPARCDEELRAAVMATTLAKAQRSDVLFAARILVIIESHQKERGIPLPAWFEGYGVYLQRAIFLLDQERPPTTPLH